MKSRALAVKSVVTHREQRDTIRRTWGNGTYYNSFPIKCIFLFGSQDREIFHTSHVYLTGFNPHKISIVTHFRGLRNSVRRAGRIRRPSGGQFPRLVPKLNIQGQYGTGFEK